MDVGGCKTNFGPAPRTTKLTVHRETPTAEDDLLAGEWAISPKSIAAFRHLANTLIEDSPSLVFVNSRSTAETVAQRLASIVPELQVGVHHGSLAAETRREMEESLRAGELHGLICTSSLELGIDIGSIRRVHQNWNSPRAVQTGCRNVLEELSITWEEHEEAISSHGKLMISQNVR